MVTEVIGIDHIYIAVSDMTRSEVFYDLVMTELGFRKNSFVLNYAGHIQYYNRQFGYVLRPANEDTPTHNSYHTGLHHLCFRVQSVDDVFGVAKRNVAGAQIIKFFYFANIPADGVTVLNTYKNTGFTLFFIFDGVTAVQCQIKFNWVLFQQGMYRIKNLHSPFMGFYVMR